nr:Rne/Rng family ribonuclease [uncultured Desulfobulbus sp.]
MTKKETKEKATPVRKAKKGAWWKSLTPEPEPEGAEQATPIPESVLEVAAETPTNVTEVHETPLGQGSTDPDETAAPDQPLTESAAPEAITVAAVPEPPATTTVEIEDLEPVHQPVPPPAAEKNASPNSADDGAEMVAENKEPQAEPEPETVAPMTAETVATEAEAPAESVVADVPVAEAMPAAGAPQPQVEGPADEAASQTASPVDPEDKKPEEAAAEEGTDGPPAKKRRSRRGGKKRSKQTEAAPAAPVAEEAEQPPTTELEAENEDDEDNDTVPEDPSTEPAKPVVYKLLINAEEPEECRIALVEDGRLESFHVTTVDREPTKNNIYKGRIVSIEANLQAAFVDIGTGRNGFLPFNEIHPEYYRQDVNERVRTLIAQQQWKKLKIEDVMQRGQEVLVQVVKEVTGNKGANMTTYLSLPGRFLVLMPGSDSAGISRKIVGEERRASLREIMSEFEIPEGIGYIIRTASVDITHNALEKDISSLLTLWEEIKRRGQTKEAPALVYEEQDTVVRFLRDHFIPEIQEILVDTQESLDNVNNFIELLPSKQRQVKVRLHRGSKPIFNQFNVEEQIESIFKPQVPLPSGGSIVINPTEALVAIDVNSGRTSKNSDFDETIFLANMEAAAELARQLRLRDLGGLIVVDFIDMRNKKHIREVERQVKASMKRDKAKVDISKISRFGLMQISRQKMGAPIEKGSYRTCEFCQGRGVVRSVETLALYYLRRIQTGITRKKIARVECRLPLDVAQYLLNKKRTELADLEAKHRATIDIIPRNEMKPTESQIDFLETDNNH